jgi:hypothetical protein
VFNGDEQTGDLFMEYHQLIEVFGRCDMPPFTLIQCLRKHLYS